MTIPSLRLDSQEVQQNFFEFIPIMDEHPNCDCRDQAFLCDEWLACFRNSIYSRDRGTVVSSQLITPNSEAAIWARLIESQPDQLTRDAAEYLLGFGFTERDYNRMQDLAERSQAGTLTDDEEREFDSYLHIGNLLSVMQSKSRLVLHGSGTSETHS
jgi:hypothetical protein